MSDEKLSKKSMKNELKSPAVTCLRYASDGFTHGPGWPHHDAILDYSPTRVAPAAGDGRCM